MTSQINKILSFSNMLSYKDQETRPEDTQQHSTTECTKKQRTLGTVPGEKLITWTLDLETHEERQKTDKSLIQTETRVGYFKPLASAFPLGSILSCSLPAFRLFRLEQVGRGDFNPTCSKSALSLLHLNNKKERKNGGKNLQHAKQPQVLTAHLHTPS